MRRGLAIVGIVVVLVVFAAVGITAVLVAGHEISKVDPSRTPSPSPTATSRG
ncbi:MAG: hypothetical protein JWP75_4186 [Frondihabitans sp.]|nr:hypothetical protein [Frondihabitans sp.]